MLALSFSGFDPGCVKTFASQDCAELFSLFSSFDGDCQSGSFLIQCNRDKLSTRKFDVGVFTQPGSKTEVAALQRDVCFAPVSVHRQAVSACPKTATGRNRSRGRTVRLTTRRRR